ncbi:acyl-CoA thioesterase [Streptomyces goshikiensis]|uniref:acyl-CoA thioesterase n=1 Tax=Streptomyces goshikiensis TaxID=1942 RepID=UPI00365461C9
MTHLDSQAAASDGTPLASSAETDGFTIEHVVTAGDTSAVGPVYYARLIDWQGRCREQAGMAGAPVFSSDISGEHAMLTRSCSCEYERELWFGDQVAIRLTVPWVRLHLMKGEFRFYRITGPGDPGGELVARGEQIWASAHRAGDHYEPGPWPAELVRCAARLGADVSRAQIAEPYRAVHRSEEAP